MELMDFPQLRKPTPTADKKLIPTTIFKYYRVDWTNDKTELCGFCDLGWGVIVESGFSLLPDFANLPAENISQVANHQNIPHRIRSTSQD